jgi:molybdopterin-containing oxidoreductase family iron-sulfur binding subunit
MVKVVDGRAVKIEGNRESPVNTGGLCALGQSSLQALYDPDRIRQPLKRSGEKYGVAQFTPISWDEAIASVASVFAKSEPRSVFLTGEVSGSFDRLISDIAEKSGSHHVIFDPLQPVAFAQAARAIYGSRGVPQLKFNKADLVINFGADFLETWISPVEFARDFAIGRRNKHPLKTIHVEPRLSLTGANADRWLCSNPGTEVSIALVLLKEILSSREHGALKGELREYAEKITKGVSVAEARAESGLASGAIESLVTLLKESKAPLIIAGGSSASTSKELELQVVVALLNLASGAVGKTIFPEETRTVRSSVEKIKELIAELENGAVGALFIAGTNPAFSLPGSFGFGSAARKAKLVVSLSTHLDESAQLADIILPSHSGLESWGVQEVGNGTHLLQQPTMAPVFDTKDIGDTLIALVNNAGFETANDVERFWRESLAKGFHKSEVKNELAPVAVPSSILSYESASIGDHRSTHDELVVFPFSSVKTFDGRAANRPWLQELPDPMTSVVWDAWVELHPETASDLKLSNGHVVSVRNHYGEVRGPVLVSPYVAKGVAAIPLGQGHKSYGRYASSVGKGNVVDLIGNQEGSFVTLTSARARVERVHERHTLVSLAGSDSQHGRGLAKTTLLAASGAPLAGGNSHGSPAHGTPSLHGESSGTSNSHGASSHHEPKQMYDQREHPLYRWGMSIDLAACTGCAACVVACYAENNIPVVGKELCSKGREMSWLRIEKYIDRDGHGASDTSSPLADGEEFTVNFLPMLCQHCNNAPCEPVCPVYATYHNEEGLNAMVYNRCVGTRYCSNNCSYKVRRFNWVDIEVPEPLSWQINPDVTKRSMGVMEKCTFCVQRIVEAKDAAKDEGLVKDGEVQPACAQSCPTQAIVFGNLNDPESKVRKLSEDERAYKILDHHINTQPAVSYLNDIKYRL